MTLFKINLLQLENKISKLQIIDRKSNKNIEENYSGVNTKIVKVSVEKDNSEKKKKQIH